MILIPRVNPKKILTRTEYRQKIDLLITCDMMNAMIEKEKIKLYFDTFPRRS